ncbi:MAG: hypothetical protein PHQ59_01015 [Candidatus Daviesbacteria bacterium]|nr:hypothetical protein [Candidatus Daviesbacteria bacterium]
MQYLKKILPILIFGGVFVIIVYFTKPPQSLTSANFIQLLLFFIPLFLFLIFLLNIFFKFYIRSFILSLGIILMIIFKSLGMLNFLSGALIIVATTFSAISFKKTRSLQQSKIQSLKLKKQR